MSDWPYEADVSEAPPLEPTWACPEGLCDCHPLTDVEPLELAVMLCDENGTRMPGARCRVLLGDRVINEDQPNADGNGWLSTSVPRPVASGVLEWAPASTPIEERYPYRVRYQVLLGTEANRAAEHRLANLGFVGGASLRDHVEAVQRQYGLSPVTGELRDIARELRAFHDEARLPPVPADRAPTAPVPPAPPPPPPPASGKKKLGDGSVPGQGTARSDTVPRELRLLDFERNPATSASYQIQVTRWRFEATADAAGVAKFRAPRGAALCNASWQLDGARYIRNAIELLAHQQPETFERLGNLGYAQQTLQQRVSAYQREMGQPVTGREEDVAQQVKEWHDGGQRPGSSEATRRNLVGNSFQLASFVPPAELQQGPAPGGALSSAGPEVIGSSGPFLKVKPPSYKPDPVLAGHFKGFDTALPKVALSVTEFSNPKRPYFGVRDDEVHFSASTCKSIALFTSSLLLSAMRRHAASVGLTVPAKKLLEKAAADFRTEILDTARNHASLKPASDADLLPIYTKAFTVVEATGSQTSHTVNFTDDMVKAIDEMMGVSSNNHSQIVIHNTGFGYIHGALVNAGLFDTALDQGLWLAGDYMGARKARRIPAVNDGDTAQGATTHTFVAMMDMALTATFPNTTFLADKLALSRVQHPSWLTEPNRSSREKDGFRDERGKIGDEALKGKFGGHFVFSEILELKHLKSGRRFLVSYQNARGKEQDAISKFVFDGLTAYVKATTPP